MVLRNIVKIDKDKCTGCGKCVNACAEGAIQLVNGKAQLISEVYCDGLGACIGHCPEDAITIEQREVAEFSEEATKAHLAEQKKSQQQSDFVCPGTMAMKLRERAATGPESTSVSSQLSHWPVQLKLVPPNAPYLGGADLLLVADCVPFAMGDFHSKFFKDHRIVVGCPKLDDSQFYIEKLTRILKTNKLNSLTVVHMEVPCCSGLTHIASEAITSSRVEIAFEDITIGLRGDVLESKTVDNR
jgi:Pyruvate/2-oxoacid:ferredoxin oxidoreductase delta subunit